MNRRILCMLALVGTAVSGPVAFQSPAGIAGVWEVSLQTPQGVTTLDVTLKQDGETVTGDVVSPMGTVTLTGKLIEDTLAIVYSIPVQGSALEITMKGTFAGETMSGTVGLGSMGEIPWTAKRKPAAVSSPSSGVTAPPSLAAADTATGKWNIALRVGQGAFPLTAELTQEGEAVTGTVALPTNPANAVSVRGTMVGTALKLDFVVPTPQGEMAVAMTGDLGAAGFTGKASLGALGDADWTGTRVP